MNRRGFLGRFGVLAPLVAATTMAQHTVVASLDLPRARANVLCPQCGDYMMIVTPRAQRHAPNPALTWSCGRCRRSWVVPTTPVEATEVPFDAGNGDFR